MLANPRAGGGPGSLVFCGTGPGRIGSETIGPSWYKGFVPRLGLAWTLVSKTVVRASAGGIEPVFN